VASAALGSGLAVGSTVDISIHIRPRPNPDPHGLNRFL